MAVTVAWSPRRARAFRVAVAFGDEAGRQWGRRRRAQRHFRRTRLGFHRLLFLPVKSRSMQCAAPTGAESSASEESETEWGGTWRWRLRVLGYVMCCRLWRGRWVGVGRVGFCGHQHGTSGRRGCRGGNGEKRVERSLARCQRVSFDEFWRGALAADSRCAFVRWWFDRLEGWSWSCFIWEEMAHHR